MNYNEYSKNFQEFYYWFISNDERPSVARARLDVPLDLVTILTGEELEKAKQLIFDKFDVECAKYIYIIALSVLNDKRAIPILKEQYKRYKHKHNTVSLSTGIRSDFSYEMKACLQAIKLIKKHTRAS
jgi:hypothetical protein